nr:oligosaccharide flippase family protein [Herbaspirillum sp. YR522]
MFNYGGVIWRAALSILLIPFYVHHLAPHEWGLVAICIAVQGFLTLLDAGLSQIIPRDIARASADKDGVARQFAIFSRAYFLLAAAAFCVGQLAVPWLATHWLKLTDGAPEESYASLRLAFLMFFFQFWNTVHIGYWNGMQEQHLANIRQVVFATAKHGAAASLVLFWSPTAQAYLIGFTVLTAMEWVANRTTIRRHLSGSGAKATLADLMKLTHETGILSVGVLLGLLVSQIDRFILSSMVSVSDYGRYIAVANLGLAFFQFQGPLLAAFYPRLSVELPVGETRSLRHLSIGVALLNVLPCLIAALTAPFFLNLWIHDATIVAVGTLPLQLIFLAIAVNSVYQIFYQQILVHGQGAYVIWTNAANIILVGSFVLLATPHMGIVAGGWGWLLGASIQLLAGVLWTTFFKARCSKLDSQINRSI